MILVLFAFSLGLVVGVGVAGWLAALALLPDECPDCPATCSGEYQTDEQPGDLQET